MPKAKTALFSQLAALPHSNLYARTATSSFPCDFVSSPSTRRTKGRRVPLAAEPVLGNASLLRSSAFFARLPRKFIGRGRPPLSGQLSRRLIVNAVSAAGNAASADRLCEYLQEEFKDSKSTKIELLDTGDCQVVKCSWPYSASLKPLSNLPYVVSYLKSLRQGPLCCNAVAEDSVAILKFWYDDDETKARTFFSLRAKPDVDGRASEWEMVFGKDQNQWLVRDRFFVSYILSSMVRGFQFMDAETEDALLTDLRSRKTLSQPMDLKPVLEVERDGDHSSRGPAVPWHVVLNTIRSRENAARAAKGNFPDWEAWSKQDPDEGSCVKRISLAPWSFEWLLRFVLLLQTEVLADEEQTEPSVVIDLVEPSRVLLNGTPPDLRYGLEFVVTGRTDFVVEMLYDNPQFSSCPPDVCVKRVGPWSRLDVDAMLLTMEDKDHIDLSEAGSFLRLAQWYDQKLFLANSKATDDDVGQDDVIDAEVADESDEEQSSKNGKRGGGRKGKAKKRRSRGPQVRVVNLSRNNSDSEDDSDDDDFGGFPAGLQDITQLLADPANLQRLLAGQSDDSDEDSDDEDDSKQMKIKIVSLMQQGMDDDDDNVSSGDEASTSKDKEGEGKHVKHSTSKIIKQLEKMGTMVYAPTETESKLGMEWGEFKGYQPIKAQVEESLISVIEYAELCEKISRITREHVGGSVIPRAVLFHGKPGVGKTLCARLIANHCKAHLVYLSSEAFVSKFFGESEQRLAKIFRLCRLLGDKCFVFVDEIDALLSSRGGSSEDDGTTRRLFSIFLRQLDGFDSAGSNCKLTLIAATNRKQDLDEAVVSRFEVVIDFGLPSYDDRVEILSEYARQLTLEEIKQVAEQSDGLSGRNLRDLCMAAERRFVYDFTKPNRNGQHPAAGVTTSTSTPAPSTAPSTNGTHAPSDLSSAAATPAVAEASPSSQSEPSSESVASVDAENPTAETGKGSSESSGEEAAVAEEVVPLPPLSYYLKATEDIKKKENIQTKGTFGFALT